MKSVYRYLLIYCLIYTQAIFADRVLNPSEQHIHVKAFPNNDINYFFNHNKAEAWRLVYAEITKPPADPNNQKYCSISEESPDEALSFNISEILKNAGDHFNADNIHVYYDGQSGEKALALWLNDAKIKNSYLAMAEVLIRKSNSKYTKLTPDRLLKPLRLLNDNEENKMYVCFGYLQQLTITPTQERNNNTQPIVDPKKIVFWYDGPKATAISNQATTPSQHSLKIKH